MGKKGERKGGSLGRALLRDRFGNNRSKRGSGESSMLHTAEVNDGYQWDRLNLNSVTEESSFQEFLSTAQLAGTEFRAEKLNIKYVNPKSEITNEERSGLIKMHQSYESLLKIPRRPKWNNKTAHELKTIENENFLEWRRQLAILQEVNELIMTPYEKNLEFWRQLWRVVERSDVVIQIVDARNPLLFRCEDLEKYVKEVDENKINMILINKADFLTAEQRKSWCDYFTGIGVRVAFFSALESAEPESKSLTSSKMLKKKVAQTIFEEENEIEKTYNVKNDENSNSSGSEDESNFLDASNLTSESEYESADDGLQDVLNENDGNETSLNLNNDVEESVILETNSSEILTRSKLIALFKSMGNGRKTYTEDIVTIGLVGYPNVGKSSTINAIFAEKKVSVSATPGKTKHFQTLFVDKELLLCDCPGLVMPSFVCTKAEMILHGILPIDQLRDHVPAVTLLGTLIPRHIIEDTYGIMLPSPIDEDNPDQPPTSEEILNTYAYNRGFMTQNGQPDNSRAARYVLKDFVNGKLLYCLAPPNTDQSKFHTFPPRRKVFSVNRVLPPAAIRASRGVVVNPEAMDKAFFQNNSSGVHVKGLPGQMKLQNSMDLGDKPWKKMNKHANKKKHEKTRRLYSYLDRH
ncbi:hypothetical protein PV328_011162 [Microctonus aethiopoides]|uniref:Large subunit GTPase 1 homolog n=1 Tax=Microctonus aethiopoides TaxID=144406 RepID=A0AA39C3X6_9HYME|nr:hypothetical protein PV328_011162 [Microctonus aethiopoides]